MLVMIKTYAVSSKQLASNNNMVYFSLPSHPTVFFKAVGPSSRKQGSQGTEGAQRCEYKVAVVCQPLRREER